MEEEEEEMSNEEIVWELKAYLGFLESLETLDFQGGVLYGKFYKTKEEMVDFLQRAIYHLERREEI